MLTSQSMNVLAQELEKTSGILGPVTGFLAKHKVPMSLGAAREALRGQYGRQMLLGAGVGGTLGALRSPGYEADEQGQVRRRSRIGNIAHGALAGAGAVGLGALATSGGRSAAKKALQNFSTRTRYQFTGSAPGVSPGNVAGAIERGVLGAKASVPELEAHVQGWNTVPGVAKGMARNPKGVLTNAWNRMDTTGKVITGLQAADTARQAVTPTEEGGPGRAERVLGSAASSLGFMVAPSGLLPGMAIGTAAGAVGNRAGRLLDRTVRRPTPQLQAMPAQPGVV